MKLYTKEMFIQAAEKCEVSMIDANHIINYIDEYVTPIELPSDEDVKNYLNMKGHPLSYDNGFQDGAWWMRDKIKGGNQ